MIRISSDVYNADLWRKWYIRALLDVFSFLVIMLFGVYSTNPSFFRGCWGMQPLNGSALLGSHAYRGQWRCVVAEWEFVIAWMILTSFQKKVKEKKNDEWFLNAASAGLSSGSMRILVCCTNDDEDTFFSLSFTQSANRPISLDFSLRNCCVNER